MQQVGQVVIVEDIDPEGHQENRSKDRSGRPPRPQQPGHQSEQRDQANDTQQQEAVVDAESGERPSQPAMAGPRMRAEKGAGTAPRWPSASKR